MSCTVNIVDNRWKILHRSAQAVGQDRTTNHRTAKAAGIGALVSVVLVVLYYLFIILSAVTYGVFS